MEKNNYRKKQPKHAKTKWKQPKKIPKAKLLESTLNLIEEELLLKEPTTSPSRQLQTQRQSWLKTL